MMDSFDDGMFKLMFSRIYPDQCFVMHIAHMLLRDLLLDRLAASDSRASPDLSLDGDDGDDGLQIGGTAPKRFKR